MRVYLDTGVLIDYLAQRGHVGAFLRQGDRRNRTPAKLMEDASEVLDRCQRSHQALTSSLTLYEGEHALFEELSSRAKILQITDKSRYNVISARAVSAQFLAALDFFGIDVVSLDRQTFESLFSNFELQKRGVRAADALHICSAIVHNAEILISGDNHVLGLDRDLTNARGESIRCVDTDHAVQLL